MELIIDTKLNTDDNTTYGWYIYGYINRENGVVSRFETDNALVTKLTISLEEYRGILSENGSEILANGRTCFPTKEMAQYVIPLIETLIDYNMVC